MSCGRANDNGPSIKSDLEDASTQNQYIVVFKPTTQISSENKVSAKAVVMATMTKLEKQYDLPAASQVFSAALQGGVYKMDPALAKSVATHSLVAYIEKDQIARINTTQSGATWGLDRLDQVSLPLSNSYSFEGATAAASVNAYIIDTGILTSHEDFQGRAVSGYDFVDKDNDATDCNGHGTHVAGTIGGNRYGVAKNLKLIGVRVLGCAGQGSYSGVIAGVDWVTANHVGPAIANMSLGGPISQALEDAIAASIKSGVTYVVAAGNSNQSACLSSPAHLSSAIKVGSTTNEDQRSSFSNYGECVDIFAPGSDITSAWSTSSSATNTISGTSMATPHAVGVAALYLAKNPNATPAEVKTALINGATSGKVISAGVGSPNRLLNTLFLNSKPVPPVNEDSVLKNGVASALPAAASGNDRYYTFQVQANTRSLVLEISGASSSTGDADLYVKFGSKPTSSSFDCRPYTGSNNERCEMQSPQPGTYMVMIRAYAAYTGVSVKVSAQ